jgi:hypothetical protein
LNEFYFLVILPRVKQSKVNELHKFMINSSIKIVLKIKLTKSVVLKAKNLTVKTGKPRALQSVGRSKGMKREKLPASECKWVTIHRSETVKGVR